MIWSMGLILSEKTMSFYLSTQWKIRLINYCPNINLETKPLKTENMETSQPHKFTFKLSQRLDLRICKVHLPLQNLSIYFTWTNIRPHYRKKQAQYGFYSLSDIQDYIKYVIKKHETLHNNFLVHIYRLTGFIID